MKLVIQLPCFNESDTLPATLSALPKQVEGFDVVEWLVVDDGSTDGTAETARMYGAHHVVRNKQNQGLAATFQLGLETSLKLGADVIVNTDGDNQYNADDIPALVRPILDGTADIVIGDRQPATNPEFSFSKRVLQKLGSRVVALLAGTRIPDAVSGFRAISRNAARQINIVSEFSYTTEMDIQAGRRNISLASVAVRTNPTTRESRLFTSTHGFISQSAATMVRTFTMYKPLRVFFILGALFATLGMWPLLRFLSFYLSGDGSGHLQSLVLGGAMLAVSSVLFMAALIGDLIAVNRKLLEKALYRIGMLEDELQTKLGAPANHNSLESHGSPKTPFGK